MIISNATPLINFGKQGRLDILKRCFDKIFIPKSVYEEILMIEDNIESIALKQGMKENWIIVKDTEINSLLKTKVLGRGEKEAISLAFKNKALLLIDDDTAKAYAGLLKVETHGSAYVLFLACKKRIINKDEAKNIFEGMIKEGFYVSIEFYSLFLELLGKIE